MIQGDAVKFIYIVRHGSCRLLMEGAEVGTIGIGGSFGFDESDLQEDSRRDGALMIIDKAVSPYSVYSSHVKCC